MRWSGLLLPLTPLYWAIVWARAAAYRWGWARPTRVEAPVVSVGNLTFGGTGKTPTVIALTQDLVRRGRRPAVVTRGYGRSSRVPLTVIGPEPGYGPERTGDEPLELATRLPGIPIVVDADRVRGAQRAVEMGAEVIVLDDGFQHLRLARDLDLVLIDAGDPWGGGWLPPLGRLREPLAALARASAVLITKLPKQHGPDFRRIEERVIRIAGVVPVIGATLVPIRVHTDRGWQDPEVLDGRRVVACAGLGRPEGFAELLGELGAEVVGTRWFPDHHRYQPSDIEEIEAEAMRLKAVAVTTAKDAVKLPAGCRLWLLEVEMTPVGCGWDSVWRLWPERTS